MTGSTSNSTELITVNSSVNTTPLVDVINESALLRTEYPFNIIYEFVGAVGFLSNVFVLIILLTFRTRQHQQTATEFFVICQTILEALSGLFIFTQTMFEGVKTRNFVKGKLQDEMLCRIWLKKLPQWSFMISSTYSILAMTIDRFIAIVYPIFYQTKFTASSVIPKLICLGLIASAFTYVWVYIVPTSGVKEDGLCHLHELWPNSTTKRSVGFLTLMVQFFIPLFVIIFCYAAMFLALHKRVAPFSSDTENSVIMDSPSLSKFSVDQTTQNNITATNIVWTTCDRRDQESEIRNENRKLSNISLNKSNKSSKENLKNNFMNKAKISILKTSAFLAATFVACWSFNQFFYLLYNMGYVDVSNDILYSSSLILVFSNCWINGFVYGAQYKPFKSGLKAFVNKLKPNIPPSLRGKHLT